MEQLPIIDEELIKQLVADKEPLVVKDGVAQIDPSHPDYDFWMED
ncbi:hypothetical protein M3_0147 [Lysinibacillus phage vB_LfM_LysYB1]|nr:hypothetical protein M3_0147 [Lysinibacillus phage vB_LfM_LysYB1]WAB25342.1 hypothetical protein M5_0164 [Lysinibacillus phage vB_LfM_LysYB2]